MSKDVFTWYGPISGRHWELQKLSDRVKLFSESYEFHYRFSLEEWESIRQQFITALRKNKLA